MIILINTFDVLEYQGVLRALWVSRYALIALLFFEYRRCQPRSYYLSAQYALCYLLRYRLEGYALSAVTMSYASPGDTAYRITMMISFLCHASGILWNSKYFSASSTPFNAPSLLITFWSQQHYQCRYSGRWIQLRYSTQMRRIRSNISLAKSHAFQYRMPSSNISSSNAFSYTLTS